MPAPDRLRQIPSVTSLLALDEIRSLLAHHPRAVVLGAIRRLLDGYRGEASGEEGSGRTREEWTSLLIAALPAEVSAGEEISLRRVINATGIVVHTNLGRAPLPEEAIRAISDTASGYSNLEFDLAGGTRSRRLVHVEQMLLALTGAESVHVVNNNAAAVFLCLTGLARGREVIVSRGELVEIGGSFRIPEIMAASGASLVEVGTTNRTRLADYERAIGPATALLLKVHPSNFRITGFTEEATISDLVALGGRLGVPVMEDLGSGAVFDFGQAGIPGTPTIKQVLAQGPGIVTVSGDKLLGGPQAGLIVGRVELVAQIRKDPLARATRPDKVTLAALSATLGLYRAGRATTDIPVWRMLSASPTDLRKRASAIVAALPVRTARVGVRVTTLSSALGGGSLPGETIPSVGLVVEGRPPDPLLARLRTGDPPIVAHVQGEAVLLDLRTVDPADDERLAAALGRALELAR
jgi:L-seryl-tRNA(Ser) seleniumtransferase